LSPYATHVPVGRLADRAAAYGFPATTIDGEDAVTVFHAVSEAAERARGGGGPTLVVANTFRWHGHYEGDPQGYKTEEERKSHRGHDPLLRFERDAAAIPGLSPDTLQAIKTQAQARIGDAVAWASAQPKPAAASLLQDVYAP